MIGRINKSSTGGTAYTRGLKSLGETLLGSNPRWSTKVEKRKDVNFIVDILFFICYYVFKSERNRT
jgi:hypothetical protein